MNLSKKTKELLSEISTLSGDTLQRSMDLARLLELSYVFEREQALDDLAFHAKFVTKSFELMNRIGKEGEGYDKLFSEFSSSITKCQSLITVLTEGAETSIAAYFSDTYCSVGERTMNDLMQLFHDLGWYKNYRIDTRHSASSRQGE